MTDCPHCLDSDSGEGGGGGEVCASDLRTYASVCLAECHNARPLYRGRCEVGENASTGTEEEEQEGKTTAAAVAPTRRRNGNSGSLSFKLTEVN